MDARPEAWYSCSMADLPANLDENQVQLLERFDGNEARLDELVEAFPDPGEAFVFSPVHLSIKQLSRLYLDTIDEDDRHRFPSTLRRRMRDERWMERRGIFQAARTAARKDAILNAEAQVWAILGLEFHSRRIRGIWERWDALHSYVMEGLEACEEGRRQFDTALRDACRELDQLEDSLQDIMPTLAIPERAQAFWTGKSGDRGALIDRAEGMLRSVKSADKAGQVFELVVNKDSKNG